MDESGQSLDELRAEIDRIDAALHDLIQRRARVVEAVAARKAAQAGGASAIFHPAREAQILRRRLAENAGPLPASAVAQIWRALIGVFLRFQAPLSIDLCRGEDPLAQLDLVRAHFGAALPVRFHDGADRVLGAVARDEHVIGVLPLPADDEPSPWWPTLANEEPSTPRIVARLPFVETAPAERGRGALVVARAPRGASGADTTLAVMTSADAISRTRLVGWLKAAGHARAHIESRRQTSAHGPWLHLVRLPGCLDRAAEISEPLAEVSDGAVDHVVIIGGYADPIHLGEGAGS